MRSRAAWAKRRAAAVVLGTVVRRMSSVHCANLNDEEWGVDLAVSVVIRETEMGSRLFFERSGRRLQFQYKKCRFTPTLHVAKSMVWDDSYKKN